MLVVSQIEFGEAQYLSDEQQIAIGEPQATDKQLSIRPLALDMSQVNLSGTC